MKLTQPFTPVSPHGLALVIPNVTFSLGEFGPDEEDFEWKRQQDRLQGEDEEVWRIVREQENRRFVQRYGRVTPDEFFRLARRKASNLEESKEIKHSSEFVSANEEQTRPSRMMLWGGGYLVLVLIAYSVIPNFLDEEVGFIRRLLMAVFTPISFGAIVAAIIGVPWWVFNVGSQMANDAGRKGLIWRILYCLLAVLGLLMMNMLWNLLYALFVEGVWIFD